MTTRPPMLLRPLKVNSDIIQDHSDLGGARPEQISAGSIGYFVLAAAGGRICIRCIGIIYVA